MSDLSEIFDVINFDEDENKALSMIENADFDLTEHDDEGRNLADAAEDKNMQKIVKFLGSIGIRNTREGSTDDIEKYPVTSKEFIKGHTSRFFKPLQSNTSDEDLVKILDRLRDRIGKQNSFLEYFGFSLRNHLTDNINMYINSYAETFAGEGAIMSEDDTKKLIEDWYKKTDFDNINDEELGSQFIDDILINKVLDNPSVRHS